LEQGGALLLPFCCSFAQEAFERDPYEDGIDGPAPWRKRPDLTALLSAIEAAGGGSSSVQSTLHMHNALLAASQAIFSSAGASAGGSGALAPAAATASSAAARQMLGHHHASHPHGASAADAGGGGIGDEEGGGQQEDGSDGSAASAAAAGSGGEDGMIDLFGTDAVMRLTAHALAASLLPSGGQGDQRHRGARALGGGPTLAETAAFHKWDEDGNHCGWVKIPAWRAAVLAASGRNVSHSTAYRWFRAEKAAFDQDPSLDGVNGAPIPWRTRPNLADYTSPAAHPMGLSGAALVCFHPLQALTHAFRPPPPPATHTHALVHSLFTV
jgi:hypothetical protein